MKLSINGRFRKAAQAAFVSGLAAASFSVVAQEAIPPPAAAEPAPVPVTAEPAPAAPAMAAPVAEASLPVAALPQAPAAEVNDEKSVKLEKVRVTGSRVVIPGAASSSPIVTVRAEEFALQQTPEVEQVLRNLPSALASDGSNANNGSAGAATLNLRGLGSQRNLILVDGKRLTPYNINGLVDTSVISTALLERVDVVTGGASAVYGSDAISGAVNFIMKRNFEGVDIDYSNGITEKGDGDKTAIAMSLGTNLAEGRGNVSMTLNYAHRDGVQLGRRPLGRLGIVTADGGGLEDFQAGRGPAAAPAGCGGPGAVSLASGGSSTTLPTRIALFNVPNPAGGLQFREDGTLQSNCSVFNFNPFNYYETPQDRYGGGVFGRFEFNEHAEAYSRLLYSNTTVRQQVAPSGVFGTAFFTPLANPLISESARTRLIAHGEQARAAGRLSTDPSAPGYNWQDRNSNNVVDRQDYLNFNYRRRTVEFGERSTTFNNNAYQFLLGTRGNIIGDWEYDVSYQRGKSDRANVLGGYTNLANIANAVDSTDGVTCTNGDTTCVPINLFGGFGSITPAQAQYSSATAIQTESYIQNITNATVSGVFNIQRPFATRPFGVSIGLERRREEGATTPDECLKLAPTSCLGGAGGNTLPVAGGFQVNELFTEFVAPLVDGRFLAESLDLSLAYRWSDYDPTGLNRTWKYGLTWKPIDSLLLRIERQRAARAPNVGELAAPRVTGLDNALFDPCSVGNPNPITPEVRDRCIATGVAPADVGQVEDITAGQINAFFGTDTQALPKPERADTTTLGIVFRPANFGIIRNPYLSLDYYDIQISDYIGNFKAQEILDSCYISGIASECAKVVRVGGNLVNDGSGLVELTTNLQEFKAEGLEFVGSFGINANQFGKFRFALNTNYYLSQESQSASFNPLISCTGLYGTQCGNPLPKLRFSQRVSWDFRDVEVSGLWRYQGSAKIEPVQIDPARTGANDGVFPAFQSIGAFSYLDASVGYNFTKNVKASFLVTNLLDKQPPVVGNEAADTRSNSGNTFPSVYDPLGRSYSLSIGATFN